MICYECKPFDTLSTKELYQILKLRQEVFVVEQDCVYLDSDDKDFDSYHLCGWNQQFELTTYARILPKGISYEDYASIGRYVVSSGNRKAGYGIDLVQSSLAIASKLWTDSAFKISAQAHLTDFYGRSGFVCHGQPYLEDGIPHIAMIWSSKM